MHKEKEAVKERRYEGTWEILQQIDAKIQEMREKCALQSNDAREERKARACKMTW